MKILQISSMYRLLDKDKQRHSEGVAELSRELALSLGLKQDLAYICGLYHDIGYSVCKNHHPSEGYYLLNDLGFSDLAYISLLHSMSYDLDSNVKQIRRSIDLPKSIVPYIDIVSCADFIVNGKGDCVGVDKRLKEIEVKYGLKSDNYEIGKLQRIHALNWFTMNNIKYKYK